VTISEAEARAILDHPAIAERWFVPRYIAPPDPFWVRVEGAKLACARFDGGHPRTLLHFHGNGEIVHDWIGDFRRTVLGAGLDLVLAEYRGYGGSGGEPALGRALLDAVATADAAGPAERLVVYGRSLGTLFALEVAAQRNVAALVLESGIADPGERLDVPPERLGVSPEALRGALDRLLDHERKLAAHDGPVVIMHTEQDEVVDFSNAQRLAAWAGDRGELVAFSEGGHNTIHALNGPAIAHHLRKLAAP